ncbi:hypothetical protein J6590_071201 [Homalodisca vitripennis]|nr:hypothetical protein J6590_071201 [Homalodisca vitripennis]
MRTVLQSSSHHSIREQRSQNATSIDHNDQEGGPNYARTSDINSGRVCQSVERMAITYWGLFESCQEDRSVVGGDESAAERLLRVTRIPKESLVGSGYKGHYSATMARVMPRYSVTYRCVLPVSG